MNDGFYTQGIPQVSSGLTDDMKKDKAVTPPVLLISAALFGILFSYLFVKQRPGLNMAVFVVLLYGFALVNRKLFMKRTFGQEKLVTLFTIPVLFLSMYLFIGSTFLNVLSVLVILFVMFVQYLVLSGNALHKWYEPLFIIDLLFGAINRMVLSIGAFITGSVNSIFKSHSEKKKGAVIGILVGIVLLVLVVPLLLMADPKISGYVSLFFTQVHLDDVFLYLLMFLIGASAAAGPVAVAGRKEYTGSRKAWEIPDKRPIYESTTAVALSMVGVVYTLFAAVQFSYFFEAQDTVMSTLSLTSSAHAVRGFGELLFITCLNLIIIAVAMRFTKQKDGKIPAYIKTLFTLLVAFNFVIMASSHMRLMYYEDSYGYTVARFISHSFMILLAIVNVITLVKIFSSKVKVIKFVAATALLYMCVLVAINPETAVVHSNIQRYEEKGEIDAAYMFTLSGGAVAEACDFIMEHRELYDQITQDAAERKYEMYSNTLSGSWQSLNIADATAYEKLKQLP